MNNYTFGRKKQSDGRITYSLIILYFKKNKKTPYSFGYANPYFELDGLDNFVEERNKIEMALKKDIYDLDNFPKIINDKTKKQNGNRKVIGKSEANKDGVSWW